MFDTLLIANRGEIACRIMRSAKKLGIKTVAIYSQADQGAVHVQEADQAICVGPANVKESYLNQQAVLQAALVSGAGAIHPGYGFLSESAAFAREVESRGLIWVGPKPQDIEMFGDKHLARQAAIANNVPLINGTGLLINADQAIAEAERIGYPVILKAVGGGGGIGMHVCHNPGEVQEAYKVVTRLASANFKSDGVFLEQYITSARHVEVQIFGDGTGKVLVLGDRDCSLQRRHQKVIEEAPAAYLPAELREQLHESARRLAQSVNYRNAGTVEYVYDPIRKKLSFLEVNTRLQVEHPITEEVAQVDLVEWMLRLAGQGPEFLASIDPEACLSSLKPNGHAIEMRIYAEDPHHNFRPSAGKITHLKFPENVRIESAVQAGSEVSAHYDPMVAKLVVHGPDRPSALKLAQEALAQTKVNGIATNLDFMQSALKLESVQNNTYDTSSLTIVAHDSNRIDVLAAGVMTSVQDWPGRMGLWNVGISPSGPMDDLSFQLGNELLGNPSGAPGLECTLLGPSLRFNQETIIAVTGAPARIVLNGKPMPQWTAVSVPAGGVLEIGQPIEHGLRTYLLIQGGLDVPEYLGSAATFSLGGFGGYTGRELKVGDILKHHPIKDATVAGRVVPETQRIKCSRVWELGVLEGPQPAPDYFLAEDLEMFYATTWNVQTHANRSGIRLSGPKPKWARLDGGQAGLHPSNLHDNPYSVGAINVSGDTPIILGPDGPSLGGFACPLTVVSTQRWKLGQIKPGDQIRFIPLSEGKLRALQLSRSARVQELERVGMQADSTIPQAVIAQSPAEPESGIAKVKYLRCGDDNVLVEFGEMELDLGLRMRVHALGQALAEQHLSGVIDVTPGVRSLHIHIDPTILHVNKLVEVLVELHANLPKTDDLVVSSRQIYLPLSFNDPCIEQAIERYQTGVREKAPWLPSNIEFIRRINGLDTTAEVRKTMFEAQYLVLGLGDVYLGAPLAVPLDPRHRLMTTKYNPARTWTASDTVGLGGSYLCIYGMDSPGGYQLVGRTIPIWSGYQQRGPFTEGKPWLLRYFDRIKWYPVNAAELQELRAQARNGALELRIEEEVFSYREYAAFLAENRESIADFQERQAQAFEREKQIWIKNGEFDATPEEQIEPVSRTEPDLELEPDCMLIAAPMVANVWQTHLSPGDAVSNGQAVVTLEAMKLELPVMSPHDGEIVAVLVQAGQVVSPGTPIAVVRKAA